MIERIQSGAPPQRVRLLAQFVDTAGTVRDSAGRLSEFLGEVHEAAEKLDDQALLDFVCYFRRVGEAIVEPDVKKRIELYERVLDIYLEEDKPRFQAVCLHYIGQENFVLGNYAQAFEYTLRSQRLMRQVGLDRLPEIGKYLHDLALNYYYFRDYTKVKEIMRESLRYPPFGANLDMQRYNTLALAYRELGNIDSAIYYFKQTIQRAQQYGDSTWIALASGNLGGIHLEEGRYQQALSMLLLDFSYNRHNALFPEMARNAALSLAEVWLRLDRPDNALYYLRESERIQFRETNQNRFARQQRDEHFLRMYYQVLHQYYAAIGQHQEAYRYRDSLAAVSNELNRRYNAMVAKLAEDRLEIQQHQADIALGKQQQRTAAMRWTFVVLALAMGLVILGLLYCLHRVRTARQQAQAREKETLLRAQKERAEADAAKIKMALRHQLELLKKKNTLVEQLTSELDALRGRLDTSPEVLESARKKLAEAKLLTRQDWLSFRSKFNQVYHHALDKLKAENPHLTQAEERIYALTRLGVPTKQMASMLGISPESVRKSKYRLKKRLAATQ